MDPKRVVVTGLGALTPIGNSAPEFWSNLIEGKSGAAPITHFDSSKFKTRFACEIKGFDFDKYFDRPELRKMDKFTQYAMVAADEAIKDSGLDLEKINKRKRTYDDVVHGNHDGIGRQLSLFWHVFAVDSSVNKREAAGTHKTDVL